MSKAVLVTGGAGYIGSHVCKELASKGYHPVAFDDLSRGFEELVKWGPLETGSVHDEPRLLEVMQDYDVQSVMHFAAFAYVGESVAHPDIYYSNNVSGSFSLLAAMGRYGVQNLVFSSSCATYGNPTYLPLDEQHPQEPINPYGRSKLMVETALQDFRDRFGLHTVALRYFNAAGADPEGESGELHDPETHLIPLALRASLGGAPPLRVNGADYATADGTCVRDFVHVSDLATAHVAALALLEQGLENEAINLGSGRGASITEVMSAVESVTGNPVPHNVGPRRPGDPPTLFADISKAEQVLDWTPSKSQLTEIVADMWRWEMARRY